MNTPHSQLISRGWDDRSSIIPFKSVEPLKVEIIVLRNAITLYQLWTLCQIWKLFTGVNVQ